MNLDQLEATARMADSRPPLSQWWHELRTACTPERILALVRVARAAQACDKTINALTPIKLSTELSNALRALEETP